MCFRVRVDWRYSATSQHARVSWIEEGSVRSFGDRDEITQWGKVCER